METLTAKQLNTVLGYHEAPVFSVYMPTYRAHPDNAQDPYIFRKLVQQFEPAREKYAKDKDIQTIFSKFEALSDDYQFWQHNREGLAVFATRATFDVYRLRRPVQPLAIVADSAHIKPLLKYLQASDRYHVLVLSTDTAQLYEGDRYQLDEIDLTQQDVPDAMIDALDHELRDLHATLAAYRTTTGERWDVAQNHGLKKTDIDNDIEQFFRAVDRGIILKYSIPTRLPLILAALPEHHHLFQRITRNKQLLDEGIKINAMALSKEALRKLAWEVFQPRYDAQLNAIIGEFRHATTKRLGADQIDEIVKDAYDGKVATLLLEENRMVPGRVVDRNNVIVHAENIDHPADDLLNDLAELVLHYGGDVWVIPKDKMPSETGAASINRF
ncbi:baeRF3 domain-containing protein [Parapedobacter sp. DT-150]|uniref:baeRF3 domain-containing protein n=1 Tax=Parapedobacter sp. DT-150 TaxID=3396162 RepID=UPI003F1A2483